MNFFKNLCFQKLTALLLALLMLFALPSCNQGDGDVTTPTSDTTTAQTTPENPEPENPAPENPEPENPPVVQMLPAQEVLVLSQNVLNGNAASIAQRAPVMIEYFLASNADSIGVQECVANWADALDEGLKEKYARVGVECGSGADKGSFATYVYYRKDKYRVIATDTFWMSETPDVPSKYNSTVTMNRTCTWVILEDIETGFRYVHMNCHLDWEDDSANVVQTTMIRNLLNRFAEMGYPVFATGDYNTAEQSVSYRQMLSGDWIRDSRYVAQKTDATFSHFGNAANIDYCFVTGDYMTVKEFDVVENLHGTVEVSDHNGIFVHAEVRSLPKQTHPVPQLADGTEITLTGFDHLGKNATLSIPQASDADGYVAKTYEIVLKDSNGNKLAQSVAHGNAYRALSPPVAIGEISGGVSGETYQLEITPISLFGEKGRTLTQTVVWNTDALTQVQKPMNPDLLDLAVQNGVPTDRSPNQFTMTQAGAVTLAENAMVFDKNGCFRTPKLSSEYIKMADGFAIELILTTGADVQSSQSYASNHHAGGFGLSCTGGSMRFTVHNGKDYVHTVAAIKANTTYHVVGIFDGVNLYLYLNGALVASNTLGGSFGIPTDNDARHLCIGADSTPDGLGQSHAACTVYKVALYSEALTPGEIEYLSQNH